MCFPNEILIITLLMDILSGYQSTRFHELPKGYVPPSQGSHGSNGKSPPHPSTNSNNGSVVKGNQSTRFHELPKGYVPPSQGSHGSNGKSPPHSSTNSNKALIVKGNQSTRFYELRVHMDQMINHHLFFNQLQQWTCCQR